MASQPEPVSGTRTIDTLESAQRIIEMYPAIVLLHEDKPSFSTWLNTLDARPVDDIKFQWQTSEVIPPNDTLTASVASDGTTFAVTGDGTDEAYASANDLLYVPSTEEQVLVTAVSARNLTVTRSFGDTAAATIASGATVVRASSTWDEMSTLRDSNDAYIALTVQSGNNYNFTQFARDAVAIGHRQEASALNAGKRNYRDQQQLEKALKVAREQNVQKWFGDRASSGAKTSSGGMYRQVPTANRSTITTLTEDALENFVRGATLDGSGMRKKLFGDRFVIQKISNLMRDRQRIKPGLSQKMGVAVNEVTIGSGEVIDICGDRAFEESGKGGSAVLVDAKDVKKCVFGGMDLKLYENVEQNDQHGSVDEIADDSGLQWGHTGQQHRIDGVTA